MTTSKIELYFFRHGAKESAPEKSDQAIELTEEGRKQATNRSADEDISQSVAFGSPRKRTQHTAALRMSGQLDSVTGKETLEELKEKLDQDLAIGSKIAVDERLDFSDEFSTPYGKEFMKAFESGRLLRFLAEESDLLAEKLGDKGAETYSRMASRIAEIVKKYIAVAPQWDNLVHAGKGYKDTLKRFMGSHQGVTESFLARVIESTGGPGLRDEFVTSLDNKGFDFAEGFEVEIRNTSEEEIEVRIKFRKEGEKGHIFEYNEILSIDVIEKIAHPRL